jgi:erythromycin esterase-like protein
MDLDRYMAAGSVNILDVVESMAHPFKNSDDLAPLIDQIKGSRVVMLGEASHGTHEFYKWRSQITKELIAHHGFQFIAFEGDWPPSQQVQNFINKTGGGDSKTVLKNFKRWPTWMWANMETVELVDWLKARNTTQKVGFYGLDVYSFFESMDMVLEKAAALDPALAKKMRERYSCFEPFGRDENKYLNSLFTLPKGCEKEVLANLQTLLHSRLDMIEANKEPLFDAIQNARIVNNAEKYYRAMLSANDNSWNVRDLHMLETLEVLLNAYGSQSKGIVWAHNTHIGDHRATDMLAYGHINIGGLAREKFGEDKVSLVGFGSHHGTVVASTEWGGPTRVMRVPIALADSYEGIFHQVRRRTEMDNFYLMFDRKSREGVLSQRRGHRAIGVIYDPYHERGNYVPTQLSKRYDAFIYFDETRALTPIAVNIESKELPETYPSGM